MMRSNWFITGFIIWAILLVASCTTVEPQFESGDAHQQAASRVALGLSYLRLGRLDFAEMEFEKALKLSKLSDSAYHGLGLIAAQRHDEALAQTLLGKAVALNKNNQSAVNDYAVLLCRNQRFNKGLDVLIALKQKASIDTSIGTDLAFAGCYLGLGQLADAGDAYERALAYHPRLEQALLPMAQIKHELGHFLASRAYIERYFGAGYSSPKALLLGAEVERLLDNQQQRSQYLQKLWARYPSSAEARASRERNQ